MNIPNKPDHILATPNQWRAMKQTGDNLLVAASAGSGKTRVLVQRIIEKIKLKESLSHLLVVTYTEAAAKEMKERIEEELKKLIQKEEDQTIKLHYIQQLYQMGNASISTIHAFCLKVIRRFFYLTKLDPVFTLMSDGIEDTLLREKVWRNVQEKFLQENEAFFLMSRYFSNDRNDDGLSSIVYRLYEFSRANPDPKKWLEELPIPFFCAEKWEEHPLVNDYVLPSLKDELELLTSTVQSLLKQVYAIEVPNEHQQALEKDLDNLEALKGLMNINLSSFIEQFTTFTFETWPRFSAKKWGELKENIEKLKKQRDDVKKAFSTLVEKYFWTSPETQMKQMKELAPMMKTLSDTVLYFYEEFQMEKMRLNKVDFSDLEHLTLEILNYIDEDGKAIAATYYEHFFKEILVDEYQDVNKVQESILQKISKKAPYPSNLFMVGDVKQSIYSFRLADPSLFIDKYQRFACGDGGDRILLAENFRSSQEVLSFTNMIFSQLMNSSLGQIEYDEIAELKCGGSPVQFREIPHLSKKTELLIVEKEPTERESNLSDTKQEKSSFTSSIEAEIVLVAKKIQEIVSLQKSVVSTNEFTSLSYKDIAILTPTKTNNALIGEVFKQFDIPVKIQKSDEYFKRTEVSTMLAVLNIIDNPYQDIPFVSVLRSGIVGLTDSDLTHLRYQTKNLTFFESVLHYIESNPLKLSHRMELKENTLPYQEDLSQKMATFIAQLQEWRSLSSQLSLSELIMHIYQDTFYPIFVMGQANGIQRQTNLIALFERAHQFEQSNAKGIRNFVRYIEAVKKQDKDLAEPPSILEQEDAVRVMTIHASKGLEFPIVFLLNASKQFNLQNVTDRAVLSEQLGIGVKHIDLDKRVLSPSLSHQAIQYVLMKKELSEEMRKLYVALTRAVDKLFIVGTVTNRETFKNEWDMIRSNSETVLPQSLRLKNRGYLYWIGLCIARAVQLDGDMHDILNRKVAFGVSYYPYEEIAVWKSEVSTKTTHIQPKSKPNFETMMMDYDIESQPLIEKNYAYQQASQTTVFQTVTELKRHFEERDVLDSELNTGSTNTHIYMVPTLIKPNFSQKELQLSPKLKGTAMHLLMQKLDFSKAPSLEDVIELSQTLVHQGILEEQVTTQLPLDQIVNFFKTSFGKWLIEHHQLVKREQAFSLILPASTLFKDERKDIEERENNQLVIMDDQVLVHGVIDGYVELENEIILYDFKTDYLTHTTHEIDDIIARYKGQLNLYAKALESSIQKPVSRKVLALLSIQENVLI